MRLSQGMVGPKFARAILGKRWRRKNNKQRESGEIYHVGSMSFVTLESLQKPHMMCRCHYYYSDAPLTVPPCQGLVRDHQYDSELTKKGGFGVPLCGDRLKN